MIATRVRAEAPALAVIQNRLSCDLQMPEDLIAGSSMHIANKMITASALMILGAAGVTRAYAGDDGLTRFRETYKELVETNTTLSAGDWSPLTPRILKPVEIVAHEMWPGVPIVPALEPGASDAQFLNPAGIPTYGISGIFVDPDGGGIHGLNERVRVRSVYEGRTFLYRLVKLYASE